MTTASDIQHQLEDPPGLRAGRALRWIFSLAGLVAAVLAFVFGGRHRFVLMALALIVPAVLALEAASMRQYHRYRSGLQALIRGRLDKQAEAAKEAAKPKPPTKPGTQAKAAPATPRTRDKEMKMSGLEHLFETSTIPKARTGVLPHPIEIILPDFGEVAASAEGEGSAPEAAPEPASSKAAPSPPEPPDEAIKRALEEYEKQRRQTAAIDQAFGTLKIDPSLLDPKRFDKI